MFMELTKPKRAREALEFNVLGDAHIPWYRAHNYGIQMRSRERFNRV
jgi:hypothetical protein